MATTYKVLGQSLPVAATLTDAYTVPAGVNAILSRVLICNTSATPTKFRIAISVGGGAIANKDYLFYDQDVGPSETITVAVGAGLAATDKVRVYATLATVNFHLYGVELT